MGITAAEDIARFAILDSVPSHQRDGGVLGQ
jgi:hypothetical protein